MADISHAVVAVGSRSLEKADEFIDKFCPNGAAAQIAGQVDVKPRGYGSYAAVVEDPVRVILVWLIQNVHIVYVGTMNTSHYSDAKLALEAGKHCLLEKVSWA